MRSFSRIFITIFVFAFAIGCKKKADDSKEDDSGKLEISASLEKPSEVLDEASTSLSSTMDTDISQEMVSSLALPALLAGGFSVDDCTEHAEPLARDGDDASYKDNDGRLRNNHPRMPLQDFFCKIAKDTGAPDSFIGSISQGKMLFCFMGEGLKFDGEPRERELNKKDIEACLKDLPDKEEMIKEIGDSLVATVTASNPPAFGDKKTWDGSLEMSVKIQDQTISLQVLVKDSDGIVALASSNGADRKFNVDGYVVAINQKAGEIRYEAKFQRIRTLDKTSSNGWNRHAVALVKGKMNKDLVFTEVTEIHGAYSDISVNVGEPYPDDGDDAPVRNGNIWTVAGSVDDGIKSFAYDLSCDFDGTTSVCEDPNKAASWVATDGSSACNGVLTGETCKGDGVELTKDAQTSFVMDLDGDDFEKTEDWFKTLAVPKFDSVTLSIDQ